MGLRSKAKPRGSGGQSPRTLKQNVKLVNNFNVFHVENLGFNGKGAELTSLIRMQKVWGEIWVCEKLEKAVKGLNDIHAGRSWLKGFTAPPPLLHRILMCSCFVCV